MVPITQSERLTRSYLFVPHAHEFYYPFHILLLATMLNKRSLNIGVGSSFGVFVCFWLAPFSVLLLRGLASMMAMVRDGEETAKLRKSSLK